MYLSQKFVLLLLNKKNVISETLKNDNEFCTNPVSPTFLKISYRKISIKLCD